MLFAVTVLAFFCRVTEDINSEMLEDLLSKNRKNKPRALTKKSSRIWAEFFTPPTDDQSPSVSQQQYPSASSVSQPPQQQPSQPSHPSEPQEQASVHGERLRSESPPPSYEVVRSASSSIINNNTNSNHHEDLDHDAAQLIDSIARDHDDIDITVHVGQYMDKVKQSRGSLQRKRSFYNVITALDKIEQQMSTTAHHHQQQHSHTGNAHVPHISVDE